MLQEFPSHFSIRVTPVPFSANEPTAQQFELEVQVIALRMFVPMGLTSGESAISAYGGDYKPPVGST